MKRFKTVAVYWLLAGFLALPLPTLAALPELVGIIKHVRPAVVNIYTTQKIQTSDSENAPGKPEEKSPLDDFFKRYFEGGPDIPQDRETQSLGSGFVISADGYILTNAHLVKDADTINVRFSDYSEKPAKLVGLDERTDIALLKVKAKGLPTVTFGDSDKLEVGEWVVAIGSPFGLDYTATQGIVSALGRSLPGGSYVPFIQTDAAVNPGNSGGPLINTRGEVIGVNSQIVTQSGGYMGLSFAIPIKVAARVVEQIKKQGHASHGYLGVMIQSVTQELADSFGLKDVRGALVAQVMKNSPASRAGLQVGDVIMRFNGKPVNQSSDLPPLVSETPVGKTVSLDIIRKGKPKTLRVKIQELADTTAQAAPSRVTPSKGTELAGMHVRDLTESERKQIGLEKGGVLVIAVDAGAARDAGIREGDILMSVNNAAIKDSHQLKTLMKKLGNKRSVPVLVRRGDSQVFLSLKLR
jgi:serine protease Do